MNDEKEFFDIETLCLRCSRCCHGKELVHGKIVFTKDKCPNLVYNGDGKSSCSVYDNRLNQVIEIGGKMVRCILAEQAYKEGLLPADCPYVYYYTNGMDAKLRSFLMFQGAVQTKNWDGIAPKPKNSCNHCYGRGHIGRNIHTNAYAPCSCLNR